MNEKDQTLLPHILDSCSAIEQFMHASHVEQFKKDRLLADAVIRELEIIGEAARLLSDNTKATLNEISWQDIVDMRNKLIHEYFGVDLAIVWETVKRDIPLLKKSVGNSVDSL